jgi:hypothetical protein
MRDRCRLPFACRLLPLALLAALLLVPARAPAATCLKLPNTGQLRADLRAAHVKLTDRPFSGPRKSETYAGRCGTRSDALASFKDGELGFQDQPERFTRRGCGHRKDRRRHRRGRLLRGAEGAASHQGPGRPLLRLSP